MFIAFEGLDGSGSSTQTRLLAERLEGRGFAAIITKEPTSDTPTGRIIREVLQHKWQASPEGLQLLFSADRAEHLKNTIEPALTNGQVVITDRYFFSTLAYGALAVEMDWLKELSRFFRVPDITFLFKLDPEICLQRIRGRGSEFELFEKHEKLKKIRENYEKIKDDYPAIHLIDASGSIEEVSDAIWKVVGEKFLTK